VEKGTRKAKQQSGPRSFGEPGGRSEEGMKWGRRRGGEGAKKGEEEMRRG